MNTGLLIDSIVRQTTVLVASLATASGQRTQLAHVANLVFADLVRELRQQGLGNKVISDMFGMALRTYRRKVARLSESRTERGRSLWEAVLLHVQERGPLLRGDVLARFARDDEAVLRSVLVDLVESRLLTLEGEGDAVRFRPVLAEQEATVDDEEVALESLVLVALHRGGALDVKALAADVPASDGQLEAALDRLVEQGLVTLEQSGRQRHYRCETCIIGFGDEAGWEAAVFDHYQAMVVALVTKLRSGHRRADLGDRVGGSTFVFDLWEGHPMQGRVEGYLRSMREQGMGLRRELEAHPATSAGAADREQLRVVAYVGQSITYADTEAEDA